MESTFGTLFARANFENENQNHNDLAETKGHFMSKGKVYLRTGATFIQGTRKAVFTTSCA